MPYYMDNNHEVPDYFGYQTLNLIDKNDRSQCLRFFAKIHTAEALFCFIKNVVFLHYIVLTPSLNGILNHNLFILVSCL